MPRVAVRLATPDDRPALVGLFVEMERHYAADAAIDPGTAADRLDRGTFAPGAPAEILLAERDGEALGVACFSTLFPAEELVPLLFLKDLFVTEAARGGGVARALLAGLARLAAERGIDRVDWTTGRDNLPARKLYDGIGAHRRSDTVYYQLNGDALRKLAGTEQ